MMRRFPFFCCCTALALVGCAKSDDATIDTAAGTAAATAGAPATISLADVAGRWTVRVRPESGPDTSTTTYVLTATGDTTGWMMTHPNGPVPVRVVAVAGDSIVTQAGPFESMRRKGLQVTATSVARLQDGKLVGTSVGRYATAAGDSVLRLRLEGTRTP